ncbi:MAG: RnfABCDGE type electron transport complex subunit B [Gammaproteobacteria bacterium]|nr:RnfABCDGE type electron transport complex subunit B [Gammaproteobacteria bacterium]
MTTKHKFKMERAYQVVEIDEAACIGCTKCIQACPVDAIIGASKQMHQVLTEYCIGCGLCLPPCPVNCITVQPMEVSPEMRRQQAKTAKNRHQARKLRLQQLEAQKRAADDQVINTNLKDLIASSLARAQQKNKPRQWGADDE